MKLKNHKLLCELLGEIGIGVSWIWGIFNHNEKALWAGVIIMVIYWIWHFYILKNESNYEQ
jgi:hypothetical protein